MVGRLPAGGARADDVRSALVLGAEDELADIIALEHGGQHAQVFNCWSQEQLMGMINYMRYHQEGLWQRPHDALAGPEEEEDENDDEVVRCAHCEESVNPDDRYEGRSGDVYCCWECADSADDAYTCTWCGDGITPGDEIEDDSGDRVYCSERCQRESEHECDQCGEHFDPEASGYENYCCEDCADDAADDEEFECANCGDTYRRGDSDAEDVADYCSASC